MRSIIILILLVFSFIEIKAQTIRSQDFSKYVTAYNYIINDTLNTGKVININDLSVKLNVAVFWRELKYPNENDNSLFMRLYNIYQNIDSISNLSSLEKSKKDSKSIVFFSPILNDSILCAEVFDDKKYHNESNYNKIAFQNQSHLYLFILDTAGKIKTVSRKEMIYD